MNGYLFLLPLYVGKTGADMQVRSICCWLLFCCSSQRQQDDIKRRLKQCLLQQFVTETHGSKVLFIAGSACTLLYKGRELPYVPLCVCAHVCVYVFPRSITEPVDQFSQSQIKHYAVEGHPNV
jgi:hypothetical protein